MAERSQFWTTNNTGDGPTSGFTRQNWEDMMRLLFHAGLEASECVLEGVLNELAVSGTASPIVVGTGAAVAYGFYYLNDANTNLAITTPVVGTKGFRVVLRPCRNSDAWYDL
jgi:hypothetical protein